jgi:hypothetical protein
MSERGKPKESTRAEVRAKKGRRRPPKVPPPDSKVWPEQYRGKRWKSVYAILFAGKCQLCAYSCALPKSRQLMDKFHGMARLLLCTNHPDGNGELREVLPIETCPNFRPKRWQPRRAKRAGDAAALMGPESDPSVRRIPLGNGLFASVDADDYEELSKYKWYASRPGRTVYAICRTKGRVVYMHRMIMRPRRGYVVDHIDGNGLNNRRCNLRVCTRRQNQGNQKPRGGTSRFVGVSRWHDKWVARIQHRGKQYVLGTFDDEVEAVKARDRKAYELLGEFAHLNFPEDFDQ